MKTGKISIKIIGLLALMGLSIGIGYYHFQRTRKPLLTLTKDLDLYRLTEASSRESFLMLLDEQEKALWDCLNKEEGFSQDDFAYYTNFYAAGYERKERENAASCCKGSFSQKLRVLISEVLCEFNIDPKKITIVPYEGFSEASVLTHFIFVNEDRLKKFDEKTQRWIIAHEVVHLLKKDGMRTAILHTLFEKKLQDPNHVVNRMSRFEEMRADLLSSLNGKAYAEGCIDFLGKNVEVGADLHTYSMHPEFSLRLKTAQRVYDTVYKSGNLVVA